MDKLIDLPCRCKASLTLVYHSGDEHIGFVCQSCWKEWLPERFVPDTEEEPVCYGENTYLSPKRNISTVREDSQFQVTTFREEIIDEYAPDSLKPGDHVMWHRGWGYWHHAIVEEVKGTVVTFIECTGSEISRSERDFVEKKNLPLSLVKYANDVCGFNPVELVLARAKSLLGPKGYHLFNLNFWNFATFCKTGLNGNQQKKCLTTRSENSEEYVPHVSKFQRYEADIANFSKLSSYPESAAIQQAKL